MDENKVYRVSGKRKVEYCDEGGIVRIVRFASPAEMGEFVAKLEAEGYQKFSIEIDGSNIGDGPVMERLAGASTIKGGSRPPKACVKNL